MNKQFNSLNQVTKYFSNKQRCVEHLASLRWKDSIPVCVYCGGLKVYTCKGHGKYKCGDCKNRFTITTGTFFENTKLPLTKWFIAMYLCFSRKKGTSSHQLARDLDISQRSAWFVLHRIRSLVDTGTPQMVFNDGMVEADQAYLGGKNRFKHKNKKTPIKTGSGFKALEKKIEIVGIVQRGGKVVTKHLDENTKRPVGYLTEFLQSYIDPKVRVITDEHNAFANIGKYYKHDTIRHAEQIYVVGDVHTNTIENYWSVVKRCVYGTYHQLSAKHLQAYLNEISFRFDTRKQTEEERFNLALKGLEGRLRYDDLIKK